tara:strand:+ start:4386 stop:5369 length:984 start_codon:yes stop_codon:yes gene_type:complete
MADAEVNCPSCGELILLPRGDSNVFECPECSAGIDWNGKHIVGLRTDRNYIFPSSVKYETYFDSEHLFEAVKFANEVMDNDAIPDGLFGGGGGNETVTADDIQSDFDFSRNLGVFAGFLFIPAIFISFLLISEPDGWIASICCLAIPTGVMMVAGSPTGFSQDDMSLAHNVGGSYRRGSGSGLTLDGRFLVGYDWKHDTFNFSKFKEISSEHRISATSFYSPGGENSSPDQGYRLIYYIGETRVTYSSLHTAIHNYSRDHFLSDLNLILSFKNKMKRKSGVSFGIEIKFDFTIKFSMRKSRKKKAEIAEWVNNDSEISSLWNEITQP